MDQGAGMAAEYATKMATLHEESAARAQADMRKRQERYTLLASLQAQAQVSNLTGFFQQCAPCLFSHVMHAKSCRLNGGESSVSTLLDSGGAHCQNVQGCGLLCMHADQNISAALIIATHFLDSS